MNNILFNIRLSEERKKLGLSQEELATKLQISQKSISKYECDTRRPTFEVLIAMADLFNVSVDYLIGHTYKGDSESNSSETFLSPEDQEWLDLIHRLPEYKRADFKSRLEGYLECFEEVEPKKTGTDNRVI